MSKQDLNTGNTESLNWAWYALLVTGEIISMSPMIAPNIPEVFESDPLFKQYWKIDLDNREDLHKFLIAASIQGAKAGQVLDLILQWKITDDDAILYCKEHNIEWNIDGDQFVVHAQSFINLHDSIAGFGSSLFEAICDFFAQEVKR